MSTFNDKIKNRTYSVSAKGTRNFQSVSITEGFDVVVDETFDEFAFEAEKQRLKDRLLEETKNYLNVFTEEIAFDSDITVKKR